MPAETYNLAYLLLGRATPGSVFVPIRAMQYLAVLDREEFIFIDREGGRSIEIAWRRFQSGARESLDAPVGYEAVYYALSSAETMKRLQEANSRRPCARCRGASCQAPRPASFRWGGHGHETA